MAKYQLIDIDQSLITNIHMPNRLCTFILRLTGKDKKKKKKKKERKQSTGG